MNLCKNDCGFPETPYQQVINKESPDKRNKIPTSSRYTGKIKLLDGIWIELKSAEVESLEEGNVSLPTRESSLVKPNGFRIDCTQLGPIHRKSHQRIISIRNLFSNTPKFQKHFQRGVFLTCLIYSEDKILVTLDDFLPTFQIDEDLSSSFQGDFHWLHKISCIWNDVKFLKQEMEKCDSASALHFRLKTLQTIVTMQEALDLRDLGKVYYKPITTENNNVTFICTVSHLRSTKLVPSPNVRWIPIEKFKNKKIVSEPYAVLSNSYQSLMIYHQMSNIPLGKGLYLGYFKLVTSVDLLKLIVPEKTPSIIPHVKIRNNPQVTKHEWDLLSSMDTYSNTTFTQSNPEDISRLPGAMTEAQIMFRQQLDSSLKKLFSNLKIDRNSALNHRFYTTEVIEVSSSVTFIILLPPTDNVCLVEGDTKDLKWIEDSKLMTLPIQIFEMTHMLTYHNTLARRFIRLSATLEIETALAQHNRRKAFSTEEMSHAQHQLSILSNLQSKLELTWKDCRWILEVIKASRARDKHFITLWDFLNRYNTISPPNNNNLYQNIQSSSTESMIPFRKFPKGTYVNGNPFHKLQLLKTPRGINLQGPSPNLPRPSLPSNPNFKYESCSSLPIVSKNSPNYEKLRSSASLFDMKMVYENLNMQNGIGLDTDAILKLSSIDNQNHYQNLPIPSSAKSAMQELDSYMRHTSSRSKLVSLSTMTNKFRDISSNDKDHVPGTNEPFGLRTISWTKQRSSLDRCFGLNLHNSSGSSLLPSCNSSTSGSRELLLEEEEDSNSANGSNTNTVKSEVQKNKVVEIYAAYECGLSSGTCVRLQISNETTARQIIHLLIHKLNEEVKSKALNGPVYDSIEEFCLVSVFGARERVLRADYKPLRLTRPWDAARLYVRKKSDVTAAVSLEANFMPIKL